MVKRSVPVIVLVSLLLAALFVWSPLGAATRPQSQSSCDVSWTSATGGLWTDPDNWSTDSVPGASSRACITLDGTYTVTLAASTTVRSLTLGADNGTQTLWLRGGGGGNVTLTVTDDLANSGEVRLESDAAGFASNLTVSEGTLTNAEDGVINVNAGAGGGRAITARLDNQGADHVNSGSIDITGGNLSLVQTGDTPSFANTGQIEVAEGRTLTIQGGSFSHTSPGSISGGGTVSIQGATFSGNGPIAASVANAGHVSPGASAGALNIAGSYSQTSAGVLDLEIGGTAAGSGFDQLNVSGSVALAGTLNLTVIGNFVPAPCDSFQVITYSSRTGGFSSINGLAAGSGMFFRADLGNNGLSLVAYNTASEVNVSASTVDVTEGGASASYKVCLASQPTADVTVAVSPDAQVTVDPASLSFPLAQWNAIRSVTVSAVDDSAAEGLHEGTVRHTATSGDPRYNGIGVPSVTARVTDNEGPGEPPEAEDGSATTPEDTPIEITLVATDPDSPTLTYSIVEQPEHGDLSAISGNKVTYTPDANFHGADDFHFRASDGVNDSNAARIAITVTSVNDPPVAQNITVSTDEDKSIVITLLATDPDNDPDELDFTVVEPPDHGDLGAISGNRVRYTPDDNFVGTDTFRYRANDGDDEGNIATVPVRVGQVQNRPPVAQNGSATTEEDEDVLITLVATDPDGDSLTFSIVEQPEHGDLGDISGNRVRYEPDANFHGTDTFRFRASDGSLNSNTATITITVEPENDNPDARDDAVSTGEGDAVDIAVLANDTDVDGDSLSIASVADPAHGTAAVVSGKVRYTPDANFIGTDSFTYEVSDGHGGEDSARVTVKVVPPPQEPPGDFVGKIEFTGIVQALPASGLLGKWKIQGLTVEVTAGTEVKLETPAVIGAVARVRGFLLTNGVIQAKEIKVGDNHLPRPCNWKECGDDDDDFRWPPPCNWKPDLPACDKVKKWPGHGHGDDDEEEDD